MQEFFLINGYGVPKNILTDEHYRSYLNTAFNLIYDTAVRDGVEPVIIFSGGKTDLFKPYRRTEAGEMAKYFRSLAKRPAVAKVTKKWKYETEARALSSLENLLFAKEILGKKYSHIKNGTIIFEQTRFKRIHEVAKRIFVDFDELAFVPVDFDISSNRYDLDLINKKEAHALKLDLWSLENLKNLKVHHDVFKEKLLMLRKAGPGRHVEAIRDWWKLSVERFQNAGF